jgi:type I restriction enzyme, S subunit
LEGLDVTVIESSDLSNDGTNKRIDSDFFSKHFVANQLMLLRCVMPKESLGEVTTTIDVGHVGPMADEYIEKGVPLLLTQNVGQFRVDYSNCNRISEAFHQKLKKSQIYPGDCLIARSGTIGNAAFVLDVDPQPLNSADIIIVRADPAKVTNGFLAAFLNSSAGALQIERFTSGGVQGHINLKSIEHLIVPLPSTQFQNHIQSIVRKGMLGFHEADKIQSQAEQSLLRALGLKGWEPPEPLTYTRRASEALSAARFDAEYFAPRVAQLLTKLSADGLTIRDVAPARHDAFDASKHLADTFDYIEISGLRGDGTATSEVTPTNEAPSRASQKVHKGDIITSTVRPIRRLSAIISPEQHEHVCSSGFVVLEPKAIAPEVLLTYLRLPVVCELMDLHTSASLYPAISERDILKLPIPKIPESAAKEIITQIRHAHQARQEAQALLAKAKRAVEVAIEQGEDQAIVLLASE